ncbi:hypothetical protein [Prevotella sp. 10(H)]|uniref:hypothetical protein n=1 Tax=Prevotella sp. 10(H) TaxID=1158294 RepID=UPI0004A6CF49|nr:hypothetical protein [Prevotella sp. 10(H)]
MNCLSKNIRIYTALLITLLVLLPDSSNAQKKGPDTDTIPLYSGSTIRKSIYSQQMKKRSRGYDYFWGKHYRELYTIPITVSSSTINSLYDVLEETGKADEFHGLYMTDKNGRNFLVKPLGGSSSFIQSEFFQEMYNQADFKDTYLDEFIGDAYTIVNPYTFIASDYLARMAGLNWNDPHIYYIAQNATQDTIANGIKLEDKLVSITHIPDLNDQKNILSTEDMLKRLQDDKSSSVNQEIYIRERIFDMLIGDWNKTPENWNWRMQTAEGRTQYYPIVLDRSHAFMKVDGKLTGQMLSVLSLGFITDYKDKIKNVKKFNKLGFTLDVALTARSTQSDWITQARYLKTTLTDQVIDDAFARLPKEIQSEETDEVKRKLKVRRDNLEGTALRYYEELQFNPVIPGSDSDDRFVIDKYHRDSIRLDIYDKRSDSLVFTHNYTKKNTKEIWLYGMEGNDSFVSQGQEHNKIPVYILSSKGDNDYNIASHSKAKVFGYPSQKNVLDTVNNARVIVTDNDKIMEYDYTKTKYSSISFSPWGVYDSDWGLSLGSFVTYTQYGLKRSPFSYQHRFGFNYLKGFMYKGIFPMYDERKSFYIDAFVGSPNNFSNFFGFGNNTDGFKDEKKSYNRVKVNQYSVSPSFHYSFKPDQQIIGAAGLEIFKIRETDHRYLNEYYAGNDSIFDTRYFLDLNLTYDVNKKLSDFIPVFTTTLTAGYKMNLGQSKRNYPYAQAKVSFNFKFTDRITLATQMNGKAIFNDKYEFYQSASTELRGYRESRFIGRQSYYQISDLRFDMGKIKNPFSPLKYGLFAGFDFGRVWYPYESSKKWHVSYGGGAWVTIINKITTKYSWFGSGDDFRFMFGLGMGF